MSNFLGTTYATYNLDGTISFDLGNFMRDNSIDNNKKVTIKFINIIQINRNKSSRSVSSANIFSMLNLEDEITEGTINQFAEKANEVEKAKKEEVVAKENNKAVEGTNATTENADKTDVEVITDSKEENSNTSGENTDKVEEQKVVDEKTEEPKEVNETTEVETQSTETTTEVNESEIDN